MLEIHKNRVLFFYETSSRLPPPEALEAGHEEALDGHDDVLEDDEVYQGDGAFEHDANRDGPVDLGDVYEHGREYLVQDLEEREGELEERVIREGHGRFWFCVLSRFEFFYLMLGHVITARITADFFLGGITGHAGAAWGFRNDSGGRRTGWTSNWAW